MAYKANTKAHKPIPELPDSRNKDFWGDAEMASIETDKDVIPFEPKEGHEWRQQGPNLICDSCPLKHSIYIGMKLRLNGFNKNGTPVLIKVKM